MNKDTSGMFKTPKELLDNNPSLPDYIITRRNAASCAEFISKNRPEKDVIEAIQAKLTQAGIESKIYRTDDSDNTLALANPQQIQHAMRAMGFPEEYISWITTQAEILNANLTTKEPRSNVVIDEESGSITLGNTPLLSKIEIIQKDGKLEYVLHVKISNGIDETNLDIVKAAIEASTSHTTNEEKGTVTLNTASDIVKIMLILGCSDEQIYAAEKVAANKKLGLNNATTTPEITNSPMSGMLGGIFANVRKLHPSGIRIIQTQETSISTSTPCAKFTFEDKDTAEFAAEFLSGMGINSTISSGNILELENPAQIVRAMGAMGFTPDGIKKTINSSSLLHAASKDLPPKKHEGDNESITLTFPYSHNIKAIQFVRQDGELRCLITPHPESYIEAVKKIREIGAIKSNISYDKDTSIELKKPENVLPALKALGYSDAQIDTIINCINQQFATRVLAGSANEYFRPLYKITTRYTDNGIMEPHVEFIFTSSKILQIANEELAKAYIATSSPDNKMNHAFSLTNPDKMQEAMQIMGFESNEIKDAVDILNQVVSQANAKNALKTATDQAPTNSLAT